MKDLQKYWLPQEVPVDKAIFCRLGSLRLWLGKATKEWGFAVERGDSIAICDMNEVPIDVVPDKLNWQRIAFKDAPNSFRLAPTFPDRPVVIRPAFPVMIPVRESATFYALVPLSVELIARKENGDDVLMGILASRILSDTWFGDYESGLLCYSLAFSAEREVESLELLPHHIIVTIHLTNNSREDLNFEKLCLRTQYLSLYSSPNRLWSSEVHISNEIGSHSSSVNYSNSPPHIKNLTLVAKPKEVPVRGGFQRLTFSGSRSSDDFKFNTV